MIISFNNQAELVLFDPGIRATTSAVSLVSWCFTELWLHQQVPDSFWKLEEFFLIHSDRSVTSGNNKGVFTDNNWCTQRVPKRLCKPSVELVFSSLRPFYLQREHGNMYVRPSGNTASAATF